MTAQNRTTLKGYFETADVPTQTQFENLMDSVVIRSDDTAVTIASGLWTFTTSNIILTSGDITLSAGDANLTAGSVNVTAGNLVALAGISKTKWVETTEDPTPSTPSAGRVNLYTFSSSLTAASPETFNLSLGDSSGNLTSMKDIIQVTVRLSAIPNTTTRYFMSPVSMKNIIIHKFSLLVEGTGNDVTGVLESYAYGGTSPTTLLASDTYTGGNYINGTASNVGASVSTGNVICFTATASTGTPNALATIYYTHS